jgi:hypothetical protein
MKQFINSDMRKVIVLVISMTVLTINSSYDDNNNKNENDPNHAAHWTVTKQVIQVQNKSSESTDEEALKFSPPSYPKEENAASASTAVSKKGNGMRESNNRMMRYQLIHKNDSVHHA